MIRHFMFQIDKDDSIGGTRLDKELFNVSDISYLRYINWAKLFLGSVLPLYLTLSGVCPVSVRCPVSVTKKIPQHSLNLYRAAAVIQCVQRWVYCAPVHQRN